MNEEQKRALLKVARDIVEAVVSGKRRPKAASDDAALLEHCGCFVTLKNNGELRGCIGQFTSDRALVELVAEMAEASASRDPRFLSCPITVEELSALDIEISVLSPLKATRDPLSLRLGVDGIYITKGGYSGCFLPQVATETGWSKEQFLSYCCSHKAGLAADAWKDPRTTVQLFTAEVFGAAFSDL